LQLSNLTLYLKTSGIFSVTYQIKHTPRVFRFMIRIKVLYICFCQWDRQWPTTLYYLLP